MGDAIERDQPESPEHLIEMLAPDIRQALPVHLNPDRLLRILMTVVRTDEKLRACSPESFAASILTAAQLGLEVNTPLGHAYLIARNGECTFMPGYQGMIELAYRTGKVEAIDAEVVREGDLFEWKLGTGRKLVHEPTGNPDAPITHAYATAVIKGSTVVRFKVLRMAEIIAARDAGGFNPNRRSPWKTDFAAMAMKTAIRRLFKYLPKSPELSTAIAHDEAAMGMRPFSTAVDPQLSAPMERAGLALPPHVEPGPIDVAAEPMPEEGSAEYEGLSTQEQADIDQARDHDEREAKAAAQRTYDIRAAFETCAAHGMGDGFPGDDGGFRSEDALLGWIRANGSKVRAMAVSEKKIVATWLIREGRLLETRVIKPVVLRALRDAPEPHDPSTGEVAPEDEPSGWSDGDEGDTGDSGPH